MGKLLLAYRDENGIGGLKQLLENRHHEVVTVTNGPKALDELSRNGFDLIVVEKRLPKLGSTKLLEHVRQKGIRTPLILLCGYLKQEEIEKMEKLGFDRAFGRLFDWDEILNAIEKILLQQECALT